ncbi:hypothetical protein [Nonomuraea sp. KM90]|uniref:hypothetical protein n=1 Tax=Nonomuraea sp. KM90 TaxID=3457428 RepID=UPI003FCDED66
MAVTMSSGRARRRSALALALALATAALTALLGCSPDPPAITSPSAPQIVKLRAAARDSLTDRLDRAARTAGVRRELPRSGLDRCRKGNDDAKNDENFAAKCTLTLNRAYLWNGNVDALLDRFDSCPAEVADVRGYWKEFGGKLRSRGDSHPYDPGDLPELACDGVTMAFASSRSEARLDTMPGSQVWDPDGGMYNPYHWAPEGEPWPEAWKRTRGKGRFMIAMTVSEDYWKLEETYFHR